MHPDATGPGLRLKFVPLLVTVLLGLALTIGSALAAALFSRVLHLPSPKQSLLPFLYVQHGFQLLFALIGIAALKKWYAPADYGLHWPRGKRYFLPALLWGLALATAVNAGSAWLDVLLHVKQTTGDIVYTHQNIWGWAIFEWIYVGPTEEIPFRALLVTYLATAMPGKLRIGRFTMNWAGILVALLFALAHVHSFWTESLLDALIQQGYAFALGVLYAYWLEKSRSIVAPILAHNVSDGLTVAFWALGIFQS
jgi:membrane protease YdiL (CAAX protease family)